MHPPDAPSWGLTGSNLAREQVDMTSRVLALRHEEGRPARGQARTGTWQAEAVGPGPEHRALEVYIGRLTNEGETVSTSDAPSSATTGGPSGHFTSRPRTGAMPAGDGRDTQEDRLESPRRRWSIALQGSAWTLAYIGTSA